MNDLETISQPLKFGHYVVAYLKLFRLLGPVNICFQLWLCVPVILCISIWQYMYLLNRVCLGSQATYGIGYIYSGLQLLYVSAV